MPELQKELELDFHPLSQVDSEASDAAAISAAMAEVEQLLEDVAKSSGAAGDAIWHLLGAGGKRIRPRLTLLLAGTSTNFDGKFPIELAAASELIHTASLLHDDVIDEGTLRRGKETTRLVWSNTVSVLAGDHCLASAVDLVRRVDTGVVLAESLNAVQTLVNGELLQLRSKGTLLLDETHYRRICELKTASLFVWCSRAGVFAAGGTVKQQEAAGAMASALGLAFQIKDDLLDIAGDGRFGKRLLDDLREGRMTLPIIRAVQENPKLGEQLEAMYGADDVPADDELLAFRDGVRETSALKSVEDEVVALTQAALDHLQEFPHTLYRDLLASQVELLGERII